MTFLFVYLYGLLDFNPSSVSNFHNHHHLIYFDAKKINIFCPGKMFHSLLVTMKLAQYEFDEDERRFRVVLDRLLVF